MVTAEAIKKTQQMAQCIKDHDGRALSSQVSNQRGEKLPRFFEAVVRVLLRSLAYSVLRLAPPAYLHNKHCVT